MMINMTPTKSVKNVPAFISFPMTSITPPNHLVILQYSGSFPLYSLPSFVTGVHPGIFVVIGTMI